ncbi:MAG: DNA mismatch repair endonuclease MutL [Defluviitaleaceae bacterium]|nr:DNA mismatch repair endonuclease MutL [Defluviitaleaceae bacterium]
MDCINLLPPALINQIAAGEVVERPLSVVKELAENSIDAGASAITVEIKDGGLSLIRVTDNGRGIRPEQARTAFLQHATSKIADYDDLVNVATLGFRGEALPSIASVSRMEMVTKAAGEISGRRVALDGGALEADEEIGCADGTTVIVRNLFFNTPARLKFLKKPASEAAAVSDMMNRLAIGRPDIAFKYMSNSDAALQTNGSGDLKTAIFYVLGKEISGKLLAVDSGEGLRRVGGFAGKPEIARSNRNFQFFYINGRYVKSDLLRAAVEEAFRSMLMTGKFPVAVLKLEIPPSEVDVNVHPSKLEVRFREEEAVYGLVREAVEAGLREFDLIPENGEGRAHGKSGGRGVAGTFSEKAGTAVYLAVETERGGGALRFEQEKGAGPEPVSRQHDVYSGKKPGLREAVRDTLAGNGPREDGNAHGKPVSQMPPDLRAKPQTGANEALVQPATEGQNLPRQGKNPQEAVTVPENNRDNATDNTDKTIIAPAPAKRGSRFFEDYRIVGQAFSTYWIIEQGESLFFVDQHAAHERILYERLLKSLSEGETASQRLLYPINVELSPVERQIFLDNIKMFEDFGFDFDETGKCVIISAAPYVLRAPGDADFFMEMLDKIGKIKDSGDIFAIKRDIVATAACKAAVKGHDNLNEAEAEAIIRGLLSLDNPFTCPHGRPTIIETTKREWEKRFKRIV